MIHEVTVMSFSEPSKVSKVFLQTPITDVNAVVVAYVVEFTAILKRKDQQSAYDFYMHRGRIVCKACRKSFFDYNDFTFHKNEKCIPARKFECNLCFRVFYRTDRLKRHMLLHTVPIC